MTIGLFGVLDPLLVIIDYVPYGDLLGYLRKSRGLNDTYFKDPDVKPQTSLTSQQLIKFSWQVADGMRYLSSKNVSYFQIEGGGRTLTDCRVEFRSVYFC